MITLVADYANTLSPWFFLGVDSLALTIIVVILNTGFVLEGSNTISQVSFEKMV